MKNKTLSFILLASLTFSCRNAGNEVRNQTPSDQDVIKITAFKSPGNNYILEQGAIIRGDTTIRNLALVFTGDEFADGAEYIAATLNENGINASFFFLFNYFCFKKFTEALKKLHKNGNYLGAHSDRHLLYCDWVKRDSLLVTRQDFLDDLENNYTEMKKLGIKKEEALFFLPPYEWYNDSISKWTGEAGLRLINFSPGTRSNADYTYPDMGEKYVDSKTIHESILNYEKESSNGLNGFILLVHIGTHPGRTDKYYHFLPDLIKELKSRGYNFVRIDDLLSLH